MQTFVAHIFVYLGTIPAVAVYAVSALWVGCESLGLGVPIEPVMLFVGSLAAQGNISLPLAVLALSLGCLACASIAYAVGRRVGTPAITHFGRYIGLTPQRAEHLELWLRHRGLVGVLLARLTPMVRTFTSYILGAADIPLPAFVLGTLFGSAIYCGFWLVLGNLLGAQYQLAIAAFQHYGPVGIAALVTAILIVVSLHRLLGHWGWHRMKRHYLHATREVVPVHASDNLGA